jgi:hypothetical protein
MAVFWHVPPCSLVDTASIIKVVTPEDSHLHNHHRVNLRDHKMKFSLQVVVWTPNMFTKLVEIK